MLTVGKIRGWNTLIIELENGFDGPTSFSNIFKLFQF